MSDGPGVGRGARIHDDSWLDKGSSVGTDDSPGLTKRLAEKPDEGSADGVRLDEGPGIRMGNGPELTEGPSVGTVDDSKLDKGQADNVGLLAGPSDGMSA